MMLRLLLCVLGLGVVQLVLLMVVLMMMRLHRRHDVRNCVGRRVLQRRLRVLCLHRVCVRCLLMRLLWRLWCREAARGERRASVGHAARLASHSSVSRRSRIEITRHTACEIR